jgi:hypothetical protein
MAEFFEEYGELVAGIIVGILFVATVFGGIVYMAHDQLVQSCHDVQMSYEHGQCVYHWVRK